MKIVSFIFGILLIFFIISCGGSSSNGGGIRYSNKDVQYSASGSTLTHNADKEIERKLSETMYKELYWYCGNYKGKNNQYVFLEFKYTPLILFAGHVWGGWKLYSEYTDPNGMCR